MRYLAIALLCTFCVGTEALAEPPDNASISLVVDYFYGPTDADPILYDARLCTKVDRKTKKCVAEVGEGSTKGQTVELLTNWFAPKGSKYDDVRVEWIHEGELRKTSDITVSGALRYRTWKAKTLTKKGTWEIRVRRGEKILKSFKVNVE